MRCKFYTTIGIISLALFISSCASLAGGAEKVTTADKTPLEDCYYFNEHTYVYIARHLTWQAAKDICEAVGGHLVIISDAAENREIKKMCVETTFLGLTDEVKEGSFRRVDGTALGFSDWTNGQPSNHAPDGSVQNYAVLWKDTNYEWDDQNEAAKSSICEFEFIIDPPLLARIRDYLTGASPIRVVAKETEKSKLVRDIERKLNADNITDITAQQTFDGVKLKFSNLHFVADTAELLEAEKANLTKVGSLISQFKDRHVIVVGHTAFFGSAESCVALSLDRSRVIKDYFLAGNYLSAQNTEFQGKGYLEPIADNDREEGMQQNRRVEIIIQDTPGK